MHGDYRGSNYELWPAWRSENVTVLRLLMMIR